MVTRGYVTHRGYPALRRRVQRPRSARPRRRPQRHQRTHSQKAENAAKIKEREQRAKLREEKKAAAELSKNASPAAKQAVTLKKSVDNVETLVKKGKPTAAATKKTITDANKLKKTAEKTITDTKKVESVAKKAPKVTKVKKVTKGPYVYKKTVAKYTAYSDGCAYGRHTKGSKLKNGRYPCKKLGYSPKRLTCRRDLPRGKDGKCPAYMTKKQAVSLANKFNASVKAGRVDPVHMGAKQIKGVAGKSEQQLKASLKYRLKHQGHVLGDLSIDGRKWSQF